MFVSVDLRAAVQNADLVVLCVPVRTIIDAATAVIPACREGAIITDIGSSKGVIVREIEALIHKSKAKVSFVGSHPIAGSEKKGIDAADSIVLEGAPCVITPTFSSRETRMNSYMGKNPPRLAQHRAQRRR